MQAGEPQWSGVLLALADLSRGSSDSGSVLVSFLLAVMIYSQLKEERVYSGVQSIMVGKSKQQGLEALGHKEEKGE